MHGPKTQSLQLLSLSLLALVGVATSASGASATNWTAFSDHRMPPGPGPATHTNATVYSLIGSATGAGGPLKDIVSGLPLTAQLTVRWSGGDGPDDFGGCTDPNMGTPAWNFFNGFVDIGGADDPGIAGLRNSEMNVLTFTFSNLDPGQKYVFRGTSVRGNNYADRWAHYEIQGAASFVDAHVDGSANNNLFTMVDFPSAGLTAGQVVLNSGENRDGSLVGWDEIDPGPDGSFSIVQRQYVGTAPFGNPAAGPYGYGLNAIMLLEFGEPIAPMITDTTQPTNRVVLQNRSTTLRAMASGSPPPQYQWYKDGSAIDPAANATARTASYVISQMSAGDAGDYYCEAVNVVGTATTRTAAVGYIADTEPPKVVRATGGPSFTSIVVEFDEVVDTNTALEAFAYSVDPPLTVSAVTLIPGGSAVFLTTEAQAPDTVYTVTVSDVSDLASNPITAPNNTAQFRSWIPNSGCSGVLFQGFDVAVGSANEIRSLTNHANFPNNPFTNVFINRFHSRAVMADNSKENYGGRMRGLFIPLVSGNWRFYISSDDPGELWINPAGSGPNGRMLIARELQCCAPYRAPGNEETSEPLALIAGQTYYLEMLYKEGGGGDFGMVAARLDGTGLPVGGNDGSGELGESIGSPTLPSPFCTAGFEALPAGAAGAFSITQNLSDVSAEANTRVTFTLGVNAPDAPYSCYQWQRSDDGGASFNDIPGATFASYTTPYLTQADDHQDIYRVSVSIPGASLTSANAVLSVTPDVTRPRITRVVGLSATRIAVYYSEPMPFPSTATDGFAYEINPGIVVASGEQSPTNPLRIDLVISDAGPMTLGTLYELVASTISTSLVDASGNLIDPDPTRITFRAQGYDGNPDALIELPTDTMRSIGSLTQRGFSGRLVQIGAAIQNTIAVAEQLLAGTYIDPITGYPYPNLAPIPQFVESNIIDYYGNGADTGHILPNGVFPGIPTNALNFAFEALTYLELQRGVYRMGVNSDDNFRVTPATSVSDPNNSITLGIFDGNGRAQADTIFDFIVTEDGLYPFRLVFEQGAGGFGLEWFIRSLADGTYIAVNGNDTIKAFLPPVPQLTIVRAGNINTLSWVNATRLQDAPTITGPWLDSTNQANPQVVESYTASLDGAQDGGGARTGTGTGSVVVSDLKVTVNVTYSGLSGNVSAAHIHGPAVRGVNAGVLYGLNPTPLNAKAGAINQTVTLVAGTGGFTIAQQLQQLRDGLWYINIHTSTFGGGEIRGQIDPGGNRFFRVIE